MGEAVLIRVLLVVATASAMAACSSDVCSVPSETTATAESVEVTPVAVAEMIARGPAPTIVDVNPRNIYDEGHVPGALSMSSSGLRFDSLPVDRTEPVIFYCYNEMCGASHQAASAEVAHGWKNVSRMPPGIRGWQAAGLEVAR